MKGGLYNPTLIRSNVTIINRDLGDASGDVSYTGIGFKPRLVRFTAMLDGSTLTGSIGADDGTNHNCVEIYVTGQLFIQAAKSIYVETGTPATQSAIVKSFDTDGFTLTWTKTGASAGNISIIAECIR